MRDEPDEQSNPIRPQSSAISLMSPIRFIQVARWINHLCLSSPHGPMIQPQPMPDESDEYDGARRRVDDAAPIQKSNESDKTNVSDQSGVWCVRSARGVR